MKTRHLNEDEILQAIAGIGLPEEIHRHLDQCPECRKETEQAENMFQRLGETARQFCPEPSRRPRLEADVRHVFFKGPILVAVFSILLAVAVSWWIIPSKVPVDNKTPVVAGNGLWEDEALMTEISKLSTSALPEYYSEISSESILETDYDYMDYLVPSDDDASVSLQPDEKKQHIV